MVLCAGFGTRLRPLTDLVPKPMLPVGDRAVCLHAIGQLQAAGFGPIVMNVHHRAEAFEMVAPRAVSLVREPRILGTSGGLRNARELLGNGDVLVWNGDVVAEPDLTSLVACHNEATREGAMATLLAAPREKGEGTLGVSAERRVVRLRGECFGCEQTGGDFIGIQVVGQRVRDSLAPEGCLVGDVYLPRLRLGQHLAVCWHEGEWSDIGTPAALLRANLRWLARLGLSAWIDPTARVSTDACVRNSVVCAGGQVRGQGEVESCLVLAGGSIQAPARGRIAMPNGSEIEVLAAASG